MGKKNLSRQKKFDTRIDFTPMVDMNMLLITFFMLCTTMLKSQTLAITLPTNEDVKEENMNQAKESEAITIIIDGKQTENAQKQAVSNPEDVKFYYYEGQLDLANLNMKETDMKGTNGGAVREILQKKNEQALKKINEKKADWKSGKITEEQYQAAAKAIRNDESLSRPIVMIKPTGRASYANVVAVLDEMQINNISRFQIETLSKDDSTALGQLNVQLPPAK